MTPGPADAPLVRQLGVLLPESPDPARSARTRARCHAALARQHAKNSRRTAVTMPWRLVESALVAAVCIAYFSDLVRRAMSLH